VEIASRELTEAGAFGAPHLRAIALSACGSLESGPAPLTWLREGVAILERSQARLDYAWALVNLGVGLRDRGQREPARRQLSEALDIASRCGAIALAERARSELIATGARPRREQLTGPGSLTRAELRAAHGRGRTQQPPNRPGAVRFRQDDRDAALGGLREALDREPWELRGALEKVTAVD
jgi:hypothetical protein